jgi:hypothetical protein
VKVMIEKIWKQIKYSKQLKPERATRAVR